MKKYICRLYTSYDPEDGFKVWTRANSEEEAIEKLKREYHSVTEVFVLKVED